MMYELTTCIDQATSLAEIVRRIVTAIDPDRIFLFGSGARGDARRGSDYDLPVIKDTVERTLKLEQRAYRAMLGLLAPVDILVEILERLMVLANVPGPVYGRAPRESQVVYERT